jgi:hypothetical protein
MSKVVTTHLGIVTDKMNGLRRESAEDCRDESGIVTKEEPRAQCKHPFQVFEKLFQKYTIYQVIFSVLTLIVPLKKKRETKNLTHSFGDAALFSTISVTSGL